MSGAMVNLGIYGVILVGDELLGGGPAWWWLLVSALGVLSALYGALHAATSSDLKRLLAYSTTDNIGLVLIGIGASGLFAASGHRTLPLSRWSRRSCCCGPLRLQGSALPLGELGPVGDGDARPRPTRRTDARMPVTGVVFLVAGLAICALPPLYGFVGEWLLLQSLLHGLPSADTAVVIAISVGVAALALTGGLTAATSSRRSGSASSDGPAATTPTRRARSP